MNIVIAELAQLVITFGIILCVVALAECLRDRWSNGAKLIVIFWLAFLIWLAMP
ncbi:MAG: hypothetical protein ABI134_14035 [Byssovorax sp.]